jgi:hypothetical protein
MILTAANYLTDEMVVKKLPFLTPEEADEVIKGRATEAVNNFFSDENEPTNEDDAGEGEA